MNISRALLATAVLFACRESSRDTQRSEPEPTGIKPAELADNLLAARATFKTQLVVSTASGEAPPSPPPETLRLVHYDAAPGKLAAYLTPDPADGARHPAIIWLVGGNTNTLEDVWSQADPAEDETASQYREAGIVTMYPSLRGGNNNPGRREGFFGEVDDVLAASRFLSQLPYVNPARVYLGGHSTGGTLALLVAAAAPRGTFRAVFSFGPVADVDVYPREFLPFDAGNPRELELRSPRRWINTVSSTAFVFEGTERGNLASVALIKAATTTPLVHYFAVEDGTHLDILAPLNRYLASRIVGTWSSNPPALTAAEVAAAAAEQ